MPEYNQDRLSNPELDHLYQQIRSLFTKYSSFGQSPSVDLDLMSQIKDTWLRIEAIEKKEVPQITDNEGNDVWRKEFFYLVTREAPVEIWHNLEQLETAIDDPNMAAEDLAIMWDKMEKKLGQKIDSVTSPSTGKMNYRDQFIRDEE